MSEPRLRQPRLRQPGRAAPEEPPPVLGRWSRLYALVVVELALCILLLRVFGRVFS